MSQSYYARRCVIKIRSTAAALIAALILLLFYADDASADFNFKHFDKFLERYSDILNDYRKESLGLLQRSRVESDTVLGEEYRIIKDDILAEQEIVRRLNIFSEFRGLISQKKMKEFKVRLYREMVRIEKQRTSILIHKGRQGKNRDEYRATLSELITPDAIDIYQRLCRTMREMDGWLHLFVKELRRELRAKKE